MTTTEHPAGSQDVPGDGRSHWSLLGRYLHRAAASLRVRALAWYLLIFTLGTLVALVAIQRILLLRLDSEISSDLTQEVDELRVRASGVDPETGLSFAENLPGLVEQFVVDNVPSDGEVFIGMSDGEVVAGQPLSAVREIATPELVSAWGAVEGHRWGDIDIDAGTFRWLAVDVGTAGEATFVVLADLGTERAEVNEAIRIMALVSIAVIVLGGLTAWATTGRMLAPMRRLNRTAQRITVTDLSERVPVTDDDEMGQLSETINEMLDRLERSFSDQRKFLDDLGHELRTPLTILRGHLDLFPEDRRSQEATLELCRDELNRMSRDVESLVTLAKARQPEFLITRPIDVVELVVSALDRAEVVHLDHFFKLTGTVDVTVQGDVDRLHQALANLAANATQHAASGTTVSVRASLDGDHVRFSVTDEGPGVSAEDRERIFRRFRRGPHPERREGVGLGLAIVAAIAEGHGGQVGVDSVEGSGATFWFTVAPQPNRAEEVGAVPVPARARPGAGTLAEEHGDGALAERRK